MLLSIILLIIGLTLLSKGADFFIDGASNLALKFKIPAIIVGLTVVAMGTSAPEASVSIASALKGINGVAIGNIIGSNIANIFLILGVTSIICALNIQKNTIKYEIPFVGFITILLCALGSFFGEVNRLGAIVLLFFFALFFVYLFKISKESNNFAVEEKTLSLFKIVLFVLGGLAALVYGSNLTVNSAVDIAQRLHVSDRIIGLTIIAIGTSLPELITCVVAALKKQSDLAVGNIIGSNIFNILFVLGITGVIEPIEFSADFFFDGFIALFTVILLFVYTAKSKVLAKWQGVTFLLLYFGYIASLIYK